MCKESTQLALSWDNFQTNLQHTWRHLHQTEDFADVILACDVGQVMAHKVVLASCSPYLHSILMRLRHSHHQPVIFLSRISISDLTKLVTFMYCGQVEVEESQLESFLRAAAELHVKGLVATGDNFRKSEETSAAANKSVSKGPMVSKKISSGTSKCEDIMKGVLKSGNSSLKALPKERRGTSLAASQSSNLVQKLVTSEHDDAFLNKMPLLDEEKSTVVKVELEDVEAVKTAFEGVNEKACLSAGVKSSVGADASVLEHAQNVCQCGEMKKVGTVRKESGNKGRKFFTCPKKLQPCTGSFQWCDQVALTVQVGEHFGQTQALELNQDISSEGGSEIKEIEILDANGERIAPAKLNNHLQTMYQRLQAGMFQCNNCGKILRSRQKIMVHLESHLGLSLPCSLCTNLSKTRKSLAYHYQTKHALSVNPLIL